MVTVSEFIKADKSLDWQFSTGASANAKYVEGVMVFTMQKGGLMYEASVGGQKFKFEKTKSKKLRATQ